MKRARKDRGISSVEYIIILVLVALTGIAVFKLFGGTIKTKMTTANNTMTQRRQSAVAAAADRRMGALFSGTVGPAPAIVLLAVALTCAVTDLWKGKIYNAVTYPAMAMGLVLAICQHGVSGIFFALGGFAVGFFPAFICSRSGEWPAVTSSCSAPSAPSPAPSLPPRR